MNDLPAAKNDRDTSPVPDFQRNNGLLPAVAQDADTGQVLMLAYMNEESFAETVRTGRAVYWSRSRGRLWRKGEESGHVQHVQQILVDCDADTILLQVTQQGAACHEGYRSCFFREVTSAGLQVIDKRLVSPDEVYKTVRKAGQPKSVDGESASQTEGVDGADASESHTGESGDATR